MHQVKLYERFEVIILIALNYEVISYPFQTIKSRKQGIELLSKEMESFFCCNNDPRVISSQSILYNNAIINAIESIINLEKGKPISQCMYKVNDKYLRH